MQQVNVFIETSSRFRGNVERKCGYVLSTQLRTGKETREHFGRVTGTYHQAILLTMVDALDHMTRTCDVCFYISDLYVTSRLGKITEMARSGWLDTKGKPIANREEWRRLFKAINQLPACARSTTNQQWNVWVPLLDPVSSLHTIKTKKEEYGLMMNRSEENQNGCREQTRNEDEGIDGILEELMAHVCDELCRFREEMQGDLMDRICGRCGLQQYTEYVRWSIL